MKKMCLLFPGQGSQYVGMSRNFLSEKKYLSLLKTASKIVNEPLEKLMLEGPLEDLTKTNIAQVAILLHSYMSFLSIKDHIVPQAAIGHSLGEYSALLASEMINFEDAIFLVHQRGNLMMKACSNIQSSMAAVLGLQSHIIEEELKPYNDPKAKNYVTIANYNNDLQTVISGTKEGVMQAKDLLMEKGAKRVIELSVSAPFHCALMIDVQKQMQQIIENITFKQPKFPLIMNASGKLQDNIADIKEQIITQIASPVRFNECIILSEKLFNSLEYVELGPKTVLCGLVKKIIPQAICHNIDNLEDSQCII